jgi:hypothetical protein
MESEIAMASELRDLTPVRLVTNRLLEAMNIADEECERNSQYRPTSGPCLGCCEEAAARLVEEEPDLVRAALEDEIFVEELFASWLLASDRWAAWLAQIISEREEEEEA